MHFKCSFPSKYRNGNEKRFYKKHCRRNKNRVYWKKTFDAKKKTHKFKTSKSKGPASPEGFSWGFCAVVCCTMGLAAFLMVF